ncbi:hypothetical protein GCM10010399_90470 [Dactylosporangium fulvum]|uniref:Uncharacterized protein n=1 Tax=Dactylosporangium fulvum TaxID=53359 RepID=A0ABY5W672_9ACTN|nr:hypothetical protein [Dactylosporangium fulvum]UWP85062.1 hypothetical protein Dfulv_12870 [Dactylosporangium fulvum]
MDDGKPTVQLPAQSAPRERTPTGLLFAVLALVAVLCIGAAGTTLFG